MPVAAAAVDASVSPEAFASAVALASVLALASSLAETLASESTKADADAVDAALAEAVASFFFDFSAGFCCGRFSFDG